MANPNKILVVQTAFIGDAILASSLLETLHKSFPEAAISILVRKGNESLYAHHPFVDQLLIWDKEESKNAEFFRLRKIIKLHKFDWVINLQRYAFTGMLTGFSGAKSTFGFDKNPVSFLFTHKAKHKLHEGGHEIERNFNLIKNQVSVEAPSKPKLYGTKKDEDKIAEYINDDYICIAPSSVWYTKKLPDEKWVTLANQIPETTAIYVLGARSDDRFVASLIARFGRGNIHNLTGQLTLIQSGMLMQKAKMNYVNDSAPLHLCSAFNAPVTAFFCSTIPAFGFGPLSTNQTIVETVEELDCRPCGNHGFEDCPKGHFKCGKNIVIPQPNF